MSKIQDDIYITLYAYHYFYACFMDLTSIF